MTMQMNEFFYRGNEPHWLKNDERQRPYDYTADFEYPTSGRTLPTHEFRVPMCCPKCEEKVREELSELDGVYEIFVDQLSERVTVTGFVDPFQALKKMKRIKKKSQFWDGRSALRKSSHRDDQSTHKKPHSRHHETVYRASPSQVSYNREPSRSSSSRYRNKYGSYDDGIAYSRLRPASANRNMFDGSYDDGIAYSRLRPASANRNMFYGSYDDEISYSHLRPASANRNLSYGSYDDEISYSDPRPYRNNYNGSYDDEISYSDLRPSSSYRPVYRHIESPDFIPSSSSLFPCLPRTRSLRHATLPPFAQEYDTEEFVEEYPFYSQY